jgi:hypothetical protein
MREDMAFIKKSPWIFHYDGSSCNGCDIEVLACLMPMYDVERFGVINVGNPKHADILLITGVVNTQNRGVITTIYEQMGDPKVSGPVQPAVIFSPIVTTHLVGSTRPYRSTFTSPDALPGRRPLSTALFRLLQFWKKSGIGERTEKGISLIGHAYTDQIKRRFHDRH